MRPLTAAETATFFDDGWLTLPGVFTATDLAILRAACDRLQTLAEDLAAAGHEGLVMHRGSQFVLGKVQTGPRAGQVRIDRVVWAGAADATVLECGAQPQLLAWAGQLLAARRVQQLINQVHFKLPGDGVEFPWHQDSSHRRYGTPEWRDVSGTGSYVQMVALVDDCTLANGPLLFVRGSCRHGHIEPLDDGTLPQEFIPREDVAAVTGEAGSVVLFGPYTIHGSSANRSDGPRRLLINGYAHPDANTRVYPGDGAGRFLDVP